MRTQVILIILVKGIWIKSLRICGIDKELNEVLEQVQKEYPDYTLSAYRHIVDDIYKDWITVN